jgi:acyl-CoA thioesterase
VPLLKMSNIYQIQKKMDKYIEYFKRDKFAAACGIKLIECYPGYAKTEVNIASKHLNGADVVHGGLLFTLADFAFAAAANAYGYVTLAVSNSISYYDKCDNGLIIAEAMELAKSNRLIHCDVSIKHESGTLLASLKGTAYITKQTISF